MAERKILVGIGDADEKWCNNCYRKQGYAGVRPFEPLAYYCEEYGVELAFGDTPKRCPACIAAEAEKK